MKNILIVTLLMGWGLMISQTTTYTQAPGNSGFDAAVQSNNANTNYGSDNNIRFSRNSSGVKERGFLKFDLGVIPTSANILSAKITLQGIGHTTATAGSGVMQMVNLSWVETSVTWNNSGSLKNASQPTVNIPAPTSTAQSYTLDVTSMVQTMVNTPNVNFGWMFYLQDETTLNNKTFKFASSDHATSSLWPKIEIEYCDPIRVEAFISPASGTTNTTGGVYLNVTGGVAPYTYLWSNSATTKDIYNVAPGLYTITVTDSRGNTMNKLIPLSSDCGQKTFTILPTSGGFSAAKLVYESTSTNAQNSNYNNSSSFKAFNVDIAGGTSVGRNLLAFDLNALPSNITVNDAKLILDDDEVTQPSTFTVQLCRNLQAWDTRTVTYFTKPSYNDSVQDVIEFGYDGSASTYDLDVTQQMQNMITQVNSNLGWVLKLKDESPGATGFSAGFKTPKIVLQLTMPNFACDDNTLNWNLEQVYDENGNIISSKKPIWII